MSTNYKQTDLYDVLMYNKEFRKTAKIILNKILSNTKHTTSYTEIIKSVKDINSNVVNELFLVPMYDNYYIDKKVVKNGKSYKITSEGKKHIETLNDLDQKHLKIEKQLIDYVDKDADMFSYSSYKDIVFGNEICKKHPLKTEIIFKNMHLHTLKFISKYKYINSTMLQEWLNCDSGIAAESLSLYTDMNWISQPKDLSNIESKYDTLLYKPTLKITEAINMLKKNYNNSSVMDKISENYINNFGVKLNIPGVLSNTNMNKNELPTKEELISQSCRIIQKADQKSNTPADHASSTTGVTDRYKNYVNILKDDGQIEITINKYIRRIRVNYAIELDRNEILKDVIDYFSLDSTKVDLNRFDMSYNEFRNEVIEYINYEYINSRLLENDKNITVDDAHTSTAPIVDTPEVCSIVTHDTDPEIISTNTNSNIISENVVFNVNITDIYNNKMFVKYLISYMHDLIHHVSPDTQVHNLDIKESCISKYGKFTITCNVLTINELSIIKSIKNKYKDKLDISITMEQLSI